MPELTLASRPAIFGAAQSTTRRQLMLLGLAWYWWVVVYTAVNFVVANVYWHVWHSCTTKFNDRVYVHRKPFIFYALFPFTALDLKLDESNHVEIYTKLSVCNIERVFFYIMFHLLVFPLKPIWGTLVWVVAFIAFVVVGVIRLLRKSPIDLLDKLHSQTMEKEEQRRELIADGRISEVLQLEQPKLSPTPKLRVTYGDELEQKRQLQKEAQEKVIRLGKEIAELETQMAQEQGGVYRASETIERKRSS